MTAASGTISVVNSLQYAIFSANSLLTQVGCIAKPSSVMDRYKTDLKTTGCLKQLREKGGTASMKHLHSHKYMNKPVEPVWRAGQVSKADELGLLEHGEGLHLLDWHGVLVVVEALGEEEQGKK